MTEFDGCNYHESSTCSFAYIYIYMYINKLYLFEKKRKHEKHLLARHNNYTSSKVKNNNNNNNNRLEERTRIYKWRNFSYSDYEWQVANNTMYY